MKGDQIEGPYASYENGALYVRRCQKCGRIVAADDTTRHSVGLGAAREPNATCSKCGCIEMEFLGYFGGDAR